MEYGVGSLVTPSHMAIDLRLFKDDMTEKKINGVFWWFSVNPKHKSIGKNCAGERPLAMTPSKFDEKMDEKVTNKDGTSLPKIEFTVENDRNLIKGLYRKTFDGVIGRAVNLDWHGLGWEYEIGELMAVVMAAAGTLTKLDLSSNKLRGAAVCTRLLNQTYTKKKPIAEISSHVPFAPRRDPARARAADEPHSAHSRPECPIGYVC